jgi:hypothetical protein
VSFEKIIGLNPEYKRPSESSSYIEMLKRIQQNTPKDSVLISNVFSRTMAKNSKYDGNPRPSTYFVNSAIAQRRCYLEGWAYWTREEPDLRQNNLDEIYFHNNVEKFFELNKNYSVNYLIIDKRWPHNFKSSLWPLKRVFSNDVTEVYALKM